MIEVRSLTKKFGDSTALNNVSFNVNENCIYGMVGSNGAGKSTMIRILSGVYRQDSGTCTLDGQQIFENPAVKARIAYVSDEIYYPAGSTPDKLAKTYSSLYPKFDMDKYNRIINELGLPKTRPLNTFSKGMKRQTMTILSMATNPDYIFFDETFDGLDPVVRSYVKKLIVSDISERGASAIITSHSLRELEDTCDQLTFLHEGGIVFESDISNLKTSKFKVQIAFSGDYDRSKFDGILNVISFSKNGSVASMIVEGEREQVTEVLQNMNPILLDILPLSLEEVFTYELEAIGYSFNVDSNGKEVK